jgi:prephenate dehydrogenase
MMLGVVGLGLMGGSLALAARKTGRYDLIVGYDHSPEHEKEAIDRGIVDSVLPLDRLLATADQVVLAIPVEAIVALMPQLERIKTTAVIFDLGSTKTRIVESIPASVRHRFVAAHPMAGTEYSGPAAAFESLYADRIVVLCDTEENDPDALKAVRVLFESLGMRVVLMGAKEHDRHAAFISHLPHAISYALANSVLSQEDKQSILTLAAGGFEDMSRLAKSSAGMWIDIFKQNRDPLLNSLQIFEQEFARVVELIESESWDALQERMRSANTLHSIFKPHPKRP